ncbi:propanediol utilization protein, partial [Pseudomonas aeruginosa]
MANALTIRIETTGVVRSGNSKAGNEYHMCEAFGHLPGIPYPQRFEYYAAK